MPVPRRRYNGPKTQNVKGATPLDDLRSEPVVATQQSRFLVKVADHGIALRAGDFATRQQVSGVLGTLLD